MATKKKLLQAAAGTAAAGGGALNVEDVFSTYLYEGNGGTGQSIVNGIDLDGEGGLVWFKNRQSGSYTSIFDTERGVQKYLVSYATDAEATVSNSLTAFNSNGFTIGGSSYVNRSDAGENKYASWTFRKAPKFFTCLTYTGTGPASSANEQQVSHDLGVKPAVVIVKRTDSTSDWFFFTDVIDGSNDFGYLNQTAAFGNSGNNVPTDSVFNIGGALNVSGATYVAYLFAHNDGDGGFGDGTQDIIKCGSYTGNYNSGSEPVINLGFEPQWILFKNATTASNWVIYDTMRGWINSVGTKDYSLAPDSSAAENGVTGGSDAGTPTATGFDLEGCGLTAVNSLNDTHIYIAIRRGPMAVPESATDVFAIDVRDDTDAPMYKSGFVTDFSLYRDKDASDDWRAQSRLTGKGTLFPNTTDSESSIYTTTTWDFMNGFHEAGSINTGYLSWMWKRTPSFCDVVAYTGNGTSGRTVSHNLGVAPEMMWVKRRDASTFWRCYHAGIDVNGDNAPETDYISINSTAAAFDAPDFWNDTAPTDTVFTLGSSSDVNGSAITYIAYLFASLDGVSKVGSFTAGSSDTFVDCGFSSSARFVLMKRSSGTGDWFVYDSERGYVAGTGDKRLKLNTTDAETTNNNIDPTAGGFTVTGNTIDAGTYIFYAIA